MPVNKDRNLSVDRITEEFFRNNAAKIRGISDKVLKRIGYFTDYPEDFYSLAGEVFLSVTQTWDGERNFDAYLYSCLSNRFKSYLSKENAQKRGGLDKPDVSLYQQIGEDLTLEDTLGEEQKDESLSPEMLEYIDSLNQTQKKIYMMLTEGFEPREIQKKLKITSKVYNRELRESRAYEKIKVLKTQDTQKKKAKQEKAEKKGENEMPDMLNVAAIAGNNERTDVVKTVSMLIEDVADGTLRDDNPLQRATDNWNLEMKGNLIVTALSGFGIPPFLICERKVGDTYVQEIIDGLQRFSTFSGFVSNGFRISKKVERPFVPYKVWKKDEEGNGIVEDGLPVYEQKVFDVRGKKFSDLPRELQKKIEGYGIHCDTYLKCTNEDVEYHIRRLNSSRSMNHSQRGLTFIGSTLASVVKEISKNSFFKDTYKTTDFKNGNIQRLISEAVMLINFGDDWVSSPEKIGAYLCKNSGVSQFNDFAELVDRVDEILDEETRKMFNMRDSFLWFRIFNDFTKIGADDEKFNEFLHCFESLKEKEINGETFASLTSKNTKGGSVIQDKIDYIEVLLYDFLGEEKEEELELSYDEEIGKYVDEFYKVETEIPVAEKNRAKVAIKTAFALKEKEDLSDRSVQDALNAGELTFPDLEDGYAFTQDLSEDWLLGVKAGSSIMKEDKLPALVRLYKYAVESEADGNRAQNWFVNFADQEDSGNRKLVGNYKRDWETLKKAFDTFLAYESAA